MTRKDIDCWNLKDVIRDIISKVDTLEEIYLFGSRGFNTSSYRSDIDLLVYTRTPLKTAHLLDWLNTELNPVDLFETNDKKIGRSIKNGSSIVSGEIDLPDYLHSILLWTKKEGLITEFD